MKWENKGGKDLVVCTNRVDNNVGTYFEGFITFFVCVARKLEGCLFRCQKRAQKYIE